MKNINPADINRVSMVENVIQIKIGITANANSIAQICKIWVLNLGKNIIWVKNLEY